MAWWLPLILFSWASVQGLTYSGWLYSCFICVWTSDTVSRGCVHIRAGHILPGWVWVRWGLITGMPWASCCSTIIRISCGPGWTGRGLVGFCPCCCLKLGPASGTNLGMSSLPCAELCSLLASTSWELTWSSCQNDHWVSHWKRGVDPWPTFLDSF